MDFLQLFENDFVFVKGGAELRARVGWDELRELDGAPAVLEGLQAGGIRRLVAVAGVVAVAAGAVVKRPGDHLAVQRGVRQVQDQNLLSQARHSVSRSDLSQLEIDSWRTAYSNRQVV